MDQPLDFSKASTSTQNLLRQSTLSEKQLYSNNSKIKSLFKSHSDYIPNSENSDENLSRSSASSPSSLENEQNGLDLQQLSTGNSLSQNALLMLVNQMNFRPQFLMNAGNSGAANNLNGSKLINNGVPNTASFLLSQNFKNSAAVAAVSNMISQQSLSNQFNSQQLTNHIQQSETSKQPDDQQPTTSKQPDRSKLAAKKQQRQSLNKTVNQRKSMPKREEEKLINNSTAKINFFQPTKFNVLSNSQNSNIQSDQESSNSPFNSSNSLQLSINSNLSGEENSLYRAMFSQDNGDMSQLSATTTRRRRGQPIPDKLKDASYYQRRQKNNEAAKKSRDAKREKDLIVARRAILLTEENEQLKNNLINLKNENQILRSLIGEELFIDGNIEDIISIGRKINPEEISRFAKQFRNTYGLNNYTESMES